MTSKGDRDVDELIDAADDDARADAGGRIVPPPFAGIVARAHRLDPRAVGAERVEASTRTQAPPNAAPDAGLAPEAWVDALVSAARADAEADAETQRERPLPAMPAPVNRPRRWAAVAAAGILVAAVAVAAVGLRPTLSAQRHDTDAKSQAVAEHERVNAPDRAAEVAPPPPRKAPRRPTHVAPAPPPPVEQATVIPEEPAPLEKPARPRPKPRTRDETLSELDARAQRLLGAGRLDAADKALASLIRGGGNHRLVQAAYGDRFTIAHRTGATTRLRQLWRSYLKRFPRGRFADDARAGLCRAATASATRSCWADYLRDFPSGTYRIRAERAQEGG